MERRRGDWLSIYKIRPGILDRSFNKKNYNLGLYKITFIFYSKIKHIINMSDVILEMSRLERQ